MMTFEEEIIEAEITEEDIKAGNHFMWERQGESDIFICAKVKDGFDLINVETGQSYASWGSPKELASDMKVDQFERVELTHLRYKKV